ncbi:GNAT family N-acetyltransferase [Paenibacillus hemerocallicola]|uniref:GNAT family N-acetyltransferase n=1 Tax=Paenibacillus hemerocallicola TaxID=1172614 RepID=UPI00159ECEFA
MGARAELLQIGVSRGCKRSGSGTKLLRHAEEVVRSRWAYCLFIMTYAEDCDVIAFYGKNGFVPVATLPDVYGPGLEGKCVYAEHFAVGRGSTAGVAAARNGTRQSSLTPARETGACSRSLDGCRRAASPLCRTNAP